MLQWFKQKTLYFLFIALALVVGLGVFSYTENILNPNSMSSAKGEEIADPEPETANKEEEEKKSVVNPLNGYPLWYLPNRRPAAVIIDNQLRARPQAGLREADIIYEFPVEGGVTRFLGIYYQRIPWELGPVRSTRPYINSLALQWRANLVHAGGSPQGLSGLKDYLWHVEALKHPAFERREQRKKPHNLYFNMNHLIKDLGELSANETLPEIFVWEKNGVGSKAEVVKIYFTQQDSKVTYEYDQENDNYRRFQGDTPHVDGTTGLQLRAKNIIIQKTDTKVIDGEGRLEVELTGKGTAWVISGGKMVEATWRRSGPTDATEFVDTDGNRITLRPGQTWIEIVPEEIRVDAQ